MFKPFLPLDQAASLVGCSVTDDNGTLWYCVGHNDLGCLYFAKSQRPNVRQYWDDDLSRKLAPNYNINPY